LHFKSIEVEKKTKISKYFSQNILTLHFQNLDNPANAFKQTKHISLDIGDGFWFEEKGRMNYEIISEKKNFHSIIT